MWLQEAVWIFEDFITRLQILQKPLAEEEFKIIRNSIFKVAVALEVFALNYGKHQMIGANSSVEINSRKLGESEHDYSFGFEIIYYLFSDRHIDRWHNGCFHDLIFFAWDLLISAVARSSRFLPPIDHLFLSIIVIMDNLSGD